VQQATSVASREEARQRGLGLYREFMRCAPAIQKRYGLDIPLTEIRAGIKVFDFQQQQKKKKKKKKY
jgi:hypothetical protein